MELSAFKPLILLELAPIALSALEKLDLLDATKTKLLVELLRRICRLDRKLSTIVVNRLVSLVEASEVDALVGDLADIIVEVADEMELLVKLSMRSPNLAAELSGRLSVEDIVEVVKGALVDISGDDSIVRSSFIVVLTLIDAVVEFS